MNRILQTTFWLAMGAATALSQGPHGGGMSPGPGARTLQNSALAMTSLQTVTGSVTAVTIGYGVQYPSITINKLQIKVAPVWYLLEKSFEIKAGDTLTVVAAPSRLSTDPYLYAVEMTNVSTKAHVVLRDGAGLPLWSQQGGGLGANSGPLAGDCEALSIATESGVVEQVTVGPGIQMPTMTLKTAAGKLLAIKLGPERLLLESDLELKAGDALSVKYAVTSHDGELVALAITKAGVTVTLRSDDCRPIWN